MFPIGGGLLSYGAISAVVGTLLYANLPTRLTIGAVVPSVEFLAAAKLKKLDVGKEGSSALASPDTLAKSLFDSKPTLVMAVRRPGCAFCREQATHICSVRDQFLQKGVRVVGVVHETLGVDQFRPFFECADAIYFDPEKRFFGPQQRWLPHWMGFLRLSTYINGYRTSQGGFKGNMEGEGRLLGGVYLVDKDKMVYAHLEQEWGDEADTGELQNALKKL